MSRHVFEKILQKMRLGYSLTEQEKQELYAEIARRFSLIGMADYECEALEKAWESPHYREALENFILAWIKQKTAEKAKQKKKKSVIIVKNG